MTIKPRHKKYLFSLFLVSAIALTGWLQWTTASQSAATVFISEVSFANNDKQDWVELYNPSLHNRSLKYFYLSDDNTDPTRYQIPFELVIPSHGTVTLYGKKADRIPAGALRLSFNLGSGETLLLSAPDGSPVDRLTLLAPPEFKGTFSLGRTSLDTSKTDIFYQPSPEQVNEGLQ